MDDKINDAIYQSTLHRTMVYCEINGNIFEALAGVPIDDIHKVKEGSWQIWGSRPRPWSIHLLCPTQKKSKDGLTAQEIIQSLNMDHLDEERRKELLEELLS